MDDERENLWNTLEIFAIPNLHIKYISFQKPHIFIRVASIEGLLKKEARLFSNPEHR